MIDSHDFSFEMKIERNYVLERNLKKKNTQKWAILGGCKIMKKYAILEGTHTQGISSAPGNFWLRILKKKKNIRVYMCGYFERVWADSGNHTASVGFGYCNRSCYPLFNLVRFFSAAFSTQWVIYNDVSVMWHFRLIRRVRFWSSSTKKKWVVMAHIFCFFVAPK